MQGFFDFELAHGSETATLHIRFWSSGVVVIGRHRLEYWDGRVI